MFGQFVSSVGYFKTIFNQLLFSIVAVNCSDPPERPPSGTWEWDGNKEYNSVAQYTCGLYGKFRDTNGYKYEELTSVCGWNKSWVPEVFDPCVATSCQYIPFPPSGTDMVYVPDESNSLSLISETSFYNPKLPLSIKFPGPSFCEDNGDILMVAGEVPKKSKQPFELIILTTNDDESFHMKIDPDNDVISRWGLYNNFTEEVFGKPFDGTTIDRVEPFILRYFPNEQQLIMFVNEDWSVTLMAGT